MLRSPFCTFSSLRVAIFSEYPRVLLSRVLPFVRSELRDLEKVAELECHEILPSITKMKPTPNKGETEGTQS